MTTRAPRAGIIVTLRCMARSGAGASATRSRRRAMVVRTTRCSGSARGAPGHGDEDAALLGHRQGGAEAAADATAEGDPVVGAGLAAEPALGAEGEGVGVDVLAVVDEEDRHRDRGAG